MSLAKDELRIMMVLKDEPCTRSELSERLMMHENRVSMILQELKKCGNVGRVPGTHLLALQ